MKLGVMCINLKKRIGQANAGQGVKAKEMVSWVESRDMCGYITTINVTQKVL